MADRADAGLMSGSAVSSLVLASFLILAALATGVMLALALVGARSPLPQSVVPDTITSGGESSLIAFH